MKLRTNLKAGVVTPFGKREIQKDIKNAAETIRKHNSSNFDWVIAFGENTNKFWKSIL